MKKTVLSAALLCLAESTLHADVPLFINYQGKVADSTGLPIGATGPITAPVAAPTNRKVIFRIYDAATGGLLLWTEEQTATISLGVFSVLLGNGISLTLNSVQEPRPALDTVFTPSAATSRFLEIMVDNGDNTINGDDKPISPRQQITSTAFALHAKVADGIASSTDLTINPPPNSGTATNYGLGWYGTVRPFNSIAVDGPVLYGNNGGALGSAAGTTKKIALSWNADGVVGVGATSSYEPNNKLTLQGDDTVTPARQFIIRGTDPTTERLLLGYDTTNNRASLQSYTNATTGGPLLLNPSGGNVGIGSATTPGVALDVAGAIKASTTISAGTTIGATTSIAAGTSVAANGLSGHVFTGTGDTDGGLFSPAEGTVTLKTNNTERLRIDASGNLGIGTTTPGFPLNFANTLGDKIALYGNSGASHGFGVQGNLLQIHSDSYTADIAFGYGSSLAMTETMRIKGNGDVSIKGLVQMGSGTGTREAPNRALVIRRLNSSTIVAGSIVAVGGYGQTLVRDGTAGGFIIKTTVPRNQTVFVKVYSRNGSLLRSVNKAYYSTTADYAVCTNAENASRIEVTMAQIYGSEGGDSTEVTLTRFIDPVSQNENWGNWVGTVNSTINQ